MLCSKNCRFLRGPMSHGGGLTQNHCGRSEWEGCAPTAVDHPSACRSGGRECLRSAVSEKPLRCEPQDSALNRTKLVNLTGITKKVCDNGALGARPEGESLDTLVA